MTDRRVGSDGLRVDVKAGQPNVGGDGLNVEVVPGSLERQTDALGLIVELTVPPLAVAAFGLQTDLKGGAPTVAGYLGLLIDYVVALGIGWSGTQFVASGGTPVLWGSAAFQTSGAYPAVQFEDGAFKT